MDCKECRSHLDGVAGLPIEATEKIKIEKHVESCTECAEEFELWKQSEQFMLEFDTHASAVSAQRLETSFADGIMDRIYADEGWKMPVADRLYSLSFRMKKSLTIMIAFFMALFIISFFHSIFRTPAPTPSSESYLNSLYGMMPVAVGETSGSMTSLYSHPQGMPVASISDPLVFNIGVVPTDPNYLMIFSMLGIAVTILIMNWVSRINTKK